ncbi:MAG TPA: 16S rRNA (cytosine(1402)-N(4))-methyltransferase RsmH [Candidatus Sphingobacterium stercoripullorum]|uniref:Ribosomal RNA small subunit methyltransferase H n=1 Tax=Candidatus Sphingobacterium stercoripullorum TaxID=2838759 RepID=A0A9D2AZ20_9SPHI|nr:16S rRNA (cytosine(1402)-N(4))-methyltransferase RsmH [Candidatus Sphingobacterium stercoripullorum]HLR50669.1 16S rRNA (cytosine(1402)-N(4))-methyltransferase RsmH [Candidatus Sphingobacterium stercoripullorum]
MKGSDYHRPVLFSESLQGLMLKPNGVYVDVTFGGGGHSRGILEELGPKGKLIAFDQDPDARENLIEDPRFTFVPQNFRFLKNYLRYIGVDQVDGILADLGVSSYQFDTADRGFAVRLDGPLDMRMDKVSGLTASKIINEYEEDKLGELFWYYGEVKNSRKLAQHIVSSRLDAPIETVEQFRVVVDPLAPKGREFRYLAQVFQALRIEVNQELEALQEFLVQSVDVLKVGGRLSVISYHSLEDRLVKNFFAKGKFSGDLEKDFYGHPIKPLQVVNRKPIVAAEQEIQENKRARSAKLRIAEKL